MLRPSTCIAEPLSAMETNMLVAYATHPYPVGDKPSPAWALAAQQLLSKGMLQKTKEGIILTPEGLAAVLDPMPSELFETISAELIRTAAPPATKGHAKSDAPKRPSKARRMLAARSSRPARARS
jgi:hypothetical protein